MLGQGNCKFGAKCALAHILPDGRRVNRPNLPSGLHFGRVDTGFTSHRSALHNSLMQANTGSVGGHHSPNHSLGGGDEFPALPGQPIPPMADQTLSSSLPDAQFGSPRNPPHPDGLAVSALGTSQRTLGPLDATLPASIDRYDYSYFAKHGPFASSVPNTFGVESPPPSLPSSIRGETTVSALRRSAFGDDDGSELSRSAQLRDGSFGERILHSSSAARRNKVYSSSYGGPPQTMFNGFHGLGSGGTAAQAAAKDGGAADAESTFRFEEEVYSSIDDLLPESLAELLTPAERTRRMSRADDDAAFFGRSYTAPGTPGDVVGSPPPGSPGSWGPIINRAKREDDHSQPSGLGHVGSPLRNSYLHSDSSPIARTMNRVSAAGPGPGPDTMLFANSPGRGIGGGISVLTQSLKLSSIADTETSCSSSAAAASAKGAPANGGGRPAERIITSSPHLANNGKVAPIDEEPECQFNLEVEEDGPTSGRQSTGGFSGLLGGSTSSATSTAVPTPTSSTAVTSSSSGGGTRSSGLGLDVGERYLS